MAEIEAGMARQDGRSVERAAHALKGAMQSISAVPAARAAASLEDAVRTTDAEDAHRSLSALKLEFERLVSDLSQASAGAQS